MSQPAPEFQIIVTLLAAVNELQERVAKLEAENKELSDRLNSNSRNSSKPPSTDGYAKPSAKEKGSSGSPPESDPNDDKPNPKSLRQKSDQKPGGQKGHKGTTLKQTAEVEHMQYHPVIDCENCRQSLRCAKITKLIERQVFEPGRFGHFEVTAHVAEVKQCSCGHINHGSFPEGVDSLRRWQYTFASISWCLTSALISFSWIFSGWKSVRALFAPFHTSGPICVSGTLLSVYRGVRSDLTSTFCVVLKAIKRLLCFR